MVNYEFSDQTELNSMQRDNATQSDKDSIMLSVKVLLNQWHWINMFIIYYISRRNEEKYV